MRRGRAIADKARRASDLERLEAGGKVRITFTSHWDRQLTVAHFVVDGIECCTEMTSDPEYPSDRVLATINLAIASTVGYDGVPPAGREVGGERLEYWKQMARQVRSAFPEDFKEEER